MTGCWVSPGWRRNLHIHGHDDWPDASTTDDCAEGLAGVVVARRARPYRVTVAGYLVDTYCLGVKDALGPQLVSDSDLPTFLRRFFAASGGAACPLEVPLELARHLVWGAIDHARRLGFRAASTNGTQGRGLLMNMANCRCPPVDVAFTDAYPAISRTLIGPHGSTHPGHHGFHRHHR